MSAAQPYTSMMVANEISVLRRLHGMLENDPVQTRSQFVDLMVAAFQHGKLEPRGLSDALGHSPSTVYRWIEGRSAPHRSLWDRIVRYIMAAIDARIAASAEEADEC